MPINIDPVTGQPFTPAGAQPTAPTGGGFGLLGPSLLGLGAGLLSQGFTDVPQTGFEGLGRGFGLAQQFQDQARQRQIQQGTLEQKAAQNKIANQLSRDRNAISRAKSLQGTALQRNIAAAFDPNTPPEVRKAILAATNKSTNIILPGEKKGSQQMFKLTADTFVDAQNKASGAAARENENAIIANALNDPNLFTGSGGEIVQGFKELGSAMGMDVRGVAAGEVMRVMGDRAAIRLQEELPLGKLSDGDRKFLQQLPPGLTKSPEANRRLLLINSRNDKWQIERAKIWQGFLNENGSVSPKGFAAVARAEGQFMKEIKGHIRELRAIGNQLAPRPFTAGIPIGSMNNKQLSAQNPVNMTDAQIKETIERRKALRGGR